MVSTSELDIRAIALDLDGTLLDTANDLATAINLMLSDLALPTYDVEEVKSFVGNGMARLIKRALTRDMHAEPTPELFERAVPVFEQHYMAVLADTSVAYPGVVEALRLFRQYPIPLGCITNKAQRFTLPLLEKLGMASYFDLILGGDSLPQRKPHPLPLLHACQYFKVAPQQMLLIGDSHNDVEAAHAAGCPVFCVRYGYSNGRNVDELGADAVIDNILEVVELIGHAEHLDKRKVNGRTAI